MTKCKYWLCLCLFTIAFSTYAQEMTLLAVPSVGAKNVPETTAEVCRSMVETALIKTDLFHVLSHTDIEEILEAQAFSLSGCTDDACAEEIGL